MVLSRMHYMCEDYEESCQILNEMVELNEEIQRIQKLVNIMVNDNE